MQRIRRDPAAGQATVEFVTVLPLVLLVIAALVQAGVAAHAAWAAEQAAHAAARATAVGSDARSAARRSLPGHLERGLRLRSSSDGSTRVRLEVPALLPRVRLGVEARASFEPQS